MEAGMMTGPMQHPNVKAFHPRCSMCGYERRKIKTTAPVVAFKYISYVFCDWCDRANRGKRRG